MNPLSSGKVPDLLENTLYMLLTPNIPLKTCYPVSNRRKGISLIEIIVVLAVLSVLSLLLWSGYSRLRNAANTATCVNNLRKLASAGLRFANDHKGFLPDGGRWFSRTDGDRFSLLPYLDLSPGRREYYTPSPLSCPAAHDSNYRSTDIAGWSRTYVLNQYAMSSHDIKPEEFRRVNQSGIPVILSRIERPSDMAFFMDGSCTRVETGSRTYRGVGDYTTIFSHDAPTGSASNRTPYLHDDAIHVAFIDNSVRKISRQYAEEELGGGAGTQRNPFWGAGLSVISNYVHPLNPNRAE